MKKRKLTIRIQCLVILAICLIAVLGILAEPSDSVEGNAWYAIMITSKAVGFGAAILAGKLYKAWGLKNAMPREFENLFND